VCLCRMEIAINRGPARFCSRVFHNNRHTHSIPPSLRCGPGCCKLPCRRRGKQNTRWPKSAAQNSPRERPAPIVLPAGA
jgi:hypothetical protein